MMKRMICSVLACLLNSFILITTCFGQETAQTNEQEVISWIQQNAIPIKHIEAGKGFSDLQPLKQILKNVKVVGLGEATHGTREFFQIKHRLLEFLVKEMGFTRFAIEAPYAACQPINNYILYGKGEIENVLTGQGYVVWDTQEMAEMVGWLRAYNKTVPEEKKVKFYGLDLSNNDHGRKAILSYLKKVDSEKVKSTDSLFQVLAREEGKWPMQIDAETEKNLQHIMPRFLNFIDYLTANNERFVNSSSTAEFDQVLKYAGIMKQWILANSSTLRPPFIDGGIVRSLSMAENLIYLIDRERPEAKFVVWEHNTHLDRGNWTVLGNKLHLKMGEEYYAFSLEFNQGTFNTRTLLSGNLLGDLKEVILPPAPKESFPWYLSQTNFDILILDLRTPRKSPVVKQWLDAPQKVVLAGWVHPGDSRDFITTVDLKRSFDGIIYVDKTTASRPTKNALKSIARREGL